MPDLFKVTANHPLIQRYLTQAERGRINPVQNSAGWDFEFHFGHTTGSPIYVRPKGCTVSSNLTKIDTRTLEGVALAYRADGLVNTEVIERTCKMKSGDKDHMYEVLSGNWNLLVVLARRYYEGDRQGDLERERIAAEQLRRAQAPPQPTTRKCSQPGCDGDVQIVKPGSKAPCNKCWVYQ